MSFCAICYADEIVQFPRFIWEASLPWQPCVYWCPPPITKHLPTPLHWHGYIFRQIHAQLQWCYKTTEGSHQEKCSFHLAKMSRNVLSVVSKSCLPDGLFRCQQNHRTGDRRITMGILSQCTPGQTDWKIVAFISRSLSDVKQRYSQTEKKALAIVWAVERLHLYLCGGHFTLVTDCKPVELILISKPPARIERWNLRLQEYDFTIVHTKGVDNPSDAAPMPWSE